MRAAARIGKESGLFRVPDVVTVDEAERSLTVEWVDTFRPLGSLQWPSAEHTDVWSRLGRAIRAIHEGEWIDAQGGRRPLFHGDLDPYNVGLDGDDRLVFLDWDPAPGLGELEVSERERDLGLIQFYLVTLFVTRNRPRGYMATSIHQLVGGYCEAGDGWSPKDIHQCGLEVAAALARMSAVPAGPIFQRSYRWLVRRRARNLLCAMGPMSKLSSEANA